MEEKDLIGQRIKAARLKAKLSQDKLGELVGVAFQSVQQWEIGRTTPRAHRIRKIAAVLKISPNWLQFGTGTQEHGNVDNLVQLIGSEEFRSVSGAAFSKVLIDASRLGWVTLSKTDVSMKMFADIFHLKLLQEYGIDDAMRVQEEVTKAAIND